MQQLQLVGGLPAVKMCSARELVTATKPAVLQATLAAVGLRGFRHCRLMLAPSELTNRACGPLHAQDSISRGAPGQVLGLALARGQPDCQVAAICDAVEQDAPSWLAQTCAQPSLAWTAEAAAALQTGSAQAQLAQLESGRSSARLVGQLVPLPCTGCQVQAVQLRTLIGRSPARWPASGAQAVLSSFRSLQVDADQLDA